MKTSFGVIFHPRFHPSNLADYARRAEAAGFDELWLWDDCFLPGAFTSAAIALAATQRLKVGIGLLPATVYNPLFAAMEITTLALAFPKRILPGFGHGVGSWMTQIGAGPKSSLKALSETVIAVRQLLQGDMLTTHGEHVHLEQVQMQVTPAEAPPLYVGAMREKSLQLAGRVGDGTILTSMSSPAYVRWAWEQVRVGMADAGRADHQMAVYLDVKVNPNGSLARDAVRQSLSGRLPWADSQLNAPGLAAEVDDFIRTHGSGALAQHMPDSWLDEFAIAGAPEHVAESLQRWVAAGADSIIFQPLDADIDCLDEYARYLMPLLKP